MRIEGQCHCGRIAYEATVDPDTVGICHCTDCQTLVSRFRSSQAFAATSERTSESKRTLATL